MKNIVLFVGEKIRLNKSFREYIFRICDESFLEFQNVKFMDKIDGNFINLIEKISKTYTYLTIFATHENYGMIAKILATITDDKLELFFDETLAPSMSKRVEKNSFLLEIDGCFINVLRAEPLEKVPEILHEFDIEYKNFYIFGYDLNTINSQLESLKTTYKVDFSLCKVSKFLTLVNVKKTEFGDIYKFINAISEIFQNRIIMDENFYRFIVEKLELAGAKVTFAESCTAGLLASKIGSISGASNVFDGSLVTYSNELKNIWLNVENEIFDDFGAVSSECIQSMLKGVIESSGASFALAISGIAGPGGGSDEKPVGTVFIGVMENGGESFIGEFLLDGDRNYIREEAANIALCLLLKIREDIFFNNTEL